MMCSKYKVAVIIGMTCVLAGCTSKKNVYAPVVISSKKNNKNNRTFIMPSAVVQEQKNVHKKLVRKKRTSLQKCKPVNSFLLSPQECEARLMDIPVPVQTKLFAGEVDQKGGVLVEYESLAAFDTIACFYRQEMERVGWHKKYVFESTQHLFYHFVKPDGVCYVQVVKRGAKGWFSSEKVIIQVLQA